MQKFNVNDLLETQGFNDLVLTSRVVAGKKLFVIQVQRKRQRQSRNFLLEPASIYLDVALGSLAPNHRLINESKLDDIISVSRPYTYTECSICWDVYKFD